MMPCDAMMTGKSCVLSYDHGGAHLFFRPDARTYVVPLDMGNSICLGWQGDGGSAVVLRLDQVEILKAQLDAAMFECQKLQDKAVRARVMALEVTDGDSR